jgi:hypothetical protein
MILPVFPIKPGLVLALLLALTFVIYLPGLEGEFIFDDYENIVTNTNSHLADLSPASLQKVLGSGVSSSLGRPLAMLSFGLNTYFTGVDPFYFKLTNLVLHLCNGVALYFLAWQLARLRWDRVDTAPCTASTFALLVTAVWLLHPLNVSTVLYSVQRMTIMATLASICTLLLYCRFRLKDPASGGSALLRLLPMSLLLLLGVLSKETAALSIAMLLLLELYFIGPACPAPNQHQRLFMRASLVCFVLLPGLLAVAVLVSDPALLLGDYSTRDYSWQQRALTQPRVLWNYINWIALPDTRDLVFYHDNYRHSQGLLDPPATLLAILGLAVLAAVAWALRRRLPLVSFGIAFFFAGHLLESTVVDLELMFEHRNYLPSFGLLLALVSLLLAAPVKVLGREAKALLLVGLLVFNAHGTLVETRKWANAYGHLLFNANQNASSHRANYSLGFFYLGLAQEAPDNTTVLDAASAYFRNAATLDPHAIRGHTGLLLADSQNNKPIDQEVVDDLIERVGRVNLLDQGFAELSQLTECWYGGFCRFDKTVMAEIFSAMANNTNTPAIARQAMLEQIGSALIALYGATDDGTALLEMARGLRPDMTMIDTQLIRLALEQGKAQEAAEMIAEARGKPNAERFRAVLEELEQEARLLPQDADAAEADAGND